MPRQPIYNNASLIREVRMIAQQFFQDRNNERFWGSGKKVKAMAPKCSVCLSRGGVVKDAITVTKGEAVCGQHHVTV